MTEKPLTSRERQIVALVLEAEPNKVIAYKLGLTTGTIKGYLYLLFRKLGVPTRTALAMWARDHAAEWAK
jgi:DNA-binding NarL/FixJ family response regulator